LSPNETSLAHEHNFSEPSNNPQSQAAHREGGPPNFAFETVTTHAMSVLLKADPIPKLVVVSAPPGYGKTVLLSRLHKEFGYRGGRCIWVQLDDRDIDLASLLHRIKSAIEYEGLSLYTNPAEATAGLADRGAEVDAMVKLLTNQDTQTMMFVDNLGFCEDHGLTLFLERLIYARDSKLHLVLASTTAIPIETGRAKLEIGAFELTAKHLSFDKTTTAELLKQAGISNTNDSEIENIVIQTEGWPAAVRLLQILLTVDVTNQEHTSKLDISKVLSNFTGDHKDIAKVLTHRVLVGFEPEIVQFMVEIALVREFSHDLATHMTGRPKAKEWLTMLVQRNVLIFPLDSTRRWFRFHTLMREFLIVEGRDRLTVKRRNEVLDLAAQWHLEKGDNVTAIDIALEAGSTVLAQGLLDRMAHVVVGDHGQMGSLIKWVDRLLDAGVAPSLEVHAWFIWALCDSLQYERARQALDEFDRRVANDVLLGNAVIDLSSRLLFLRMLVNVFIDRLETAYEQANAWLENGWEESALIVSTITSIAGIAEIDRGDMMAARLRLGRARPAIDRSDSAYGLAWVGILRGCVEIGQARPDAAEELLMDVRKQVAQVIGNDASVVATIDFVRSRALLDLGQAEMARELAARGLKRAMHNGIMVSLEQGLTSCSAFWGNPNEKEITEAALDRVAHSYPLRGQKLLGASKVRRLIEQSQFDEAMAIADRIGLTKNSRVNEVIPMRDRGDWMLAGLELALARGEHDLVLEKVNKQLKEASLQERDRDRIELHLIAADAQQRLGRSGKAIHHFAMAIALATPGNVIQPFKVRMALLEQFFVNSKDKEFGLIRPTERLFLERLRFSDAAHTNVVREYHQTPTQPNDMAITTLTSSPNLREIQLLNLLSEGLNNEQAADRLSLSISTVKWHLHNLYNKLGVRNRSAALARARSLKLIR